MKATTKRAIRTQFNRLKKRLHNLDLTYILQEDSTNEHLESHYLCQINGFSARLAPITFFSKDEDDLIQQVKSRLKNMEFDEIEIAYLEANADEHQKRADFYKEQAKNAKNRLLVEGSTNDIREPLNNDEGESS